MDESDRLGIGLPARERRAAKPFAGQVPILFNLVRPERFGFPASWFVVAMMIL